VRLANSQQQQVFLGWLDIANRYPVRDPRTFSPPGPGRDQEVLFYRIQSAIELVFQRIVVERPNDYVSPRVAEQIADELDAVVNAMVHISRVREVGEFDSHCTSYTARTGASSSSSWRTASMSLLGSRGNRATTCSPTQPPGSRPPTRRRRNPSAAAAGMSPRRGVGDAYRAKISAPSSAESGIVVTGIVRRPT
jgi:hypothetical protein